MGIEGSAQSQPPATPASILAKKRQVAELFFKEKLMISPKVLGELCASQTAYEDALKLRDYVLTHKMFIVDERALALWNAATAQAAKVLEPSTAKTGDWMPRCATLEPEIAISISDSDVTDKSKCKGQVKDFVGYFCERYDRLSHNLKMMSTSGGKLSRIREAYETPGMKATVIGMVYSKKVTKNGHVLFEIEDKETLAPVLVPKDSPLMPQAQGILEDEVVAFEIYNANSLLIAKSITLPGRVVQQRTKKLATRPAKIAFLSDLHVGSRWFLQQNFQRFLAFLNGKGSEQEREIVEDLKYISISGDLVDGIGVYPRQERELVTKDIFTQYEILCDFLKAIPEHIEVIIIPGNHDAVRVAEPQPAIPFEFIKSVQGMDNLHFAGNPSVHRVEGLTLLAYHGTSTDGWISNHPNLRDGYENPHKVAMEMLNNRHLCPRYGEDSLVPEPRDYMALDFAPDLFHFGHVHKNGYANDYHGTVIINSGTWQAQTDFQVSMGHIPTPCIVPIYSMDTGVLSVLDFSGDAK